MLHFIIDGYNFIHKIPKIKNSSFPCQELLSFISRNKLTGSLNNKVWVVFDGNRPPYNIADFQYKVLFSQNKSADELIVDKVKNAQNKKQVVVVTDDRQLGYEAKQLGAKVRFIDDFVFKKPEPKKEENKKNIKHSLQREITEELKKIWLENRRKSPQ